MNKELRKIQSNISKYATENGWNKVINKEVEAFAEMVELADTQD